MALDKIFNIVSHFKFEVGSGLVTLSNLESKLGAVSKASQGVSNQFKFLFTRSALSLTGATGGIAGVIQNAIKSTEDFSKSQQKLGQILTGNKKHFVNPIKDFNEGMTISKGLLEGLVKDANKLGIGVNSYLDTFNHFNTLLIPKGAAGKNLETSKELSANFLRGSSVLGMHQSDMMWQGGSLIEGQANNRQTLFRRLRTETDAFKGLSAGQFNAKKPKERVDLLNKGLGQFTESSQLKVNPLAGQNKLFKQLMNEVEAFKGISVSQFKDKKPKEQVDLLNKGLGQLTKSSQMLEAQLKDITGQGNNKKSKERVDILHKGLGQLTDSSQKLESHLKSITGQMALIEGQAKSTQPLFKRLSAEAEAFKGISAEQFNSKKPKERMELLNKGLSQLSGKSQLLETHLKSLTGQMTILGNMFNSAGSILKPFGSIFRRFFIEGLTTLNKFLESKMSKVIKILSDDFNSLFGSLNDVYESVSKLNSIGKDIKSSRSLAGVVFFFVEFRRLLPKVASGLIKITQSLGLVLGAGTLSIIKKLGGLGKGFKALGVVMGFLFRSTLSYLKIGLPILFFMRILERAKIKAQKLDAVHISNNLDNYANKMVQLRKLYGKFINPLDYIMNKMSGLFTIFYSTSARIEALIKVLQFFGILEKDFEKTAEGINKAKKSLDSWAESILIVYSVLETTLGLILKVIVKSIQFIAKPFLELGRIIGAIAGTITAALKPLSSRYNEFTTGKRSKDDMFKNFYSDNAGVPKALRKHFTGTEDVTEKKVSIVDMYRKGAEGKTGLYGNNIDKHLSEYNDKYNKVNKAEKTRNIINIAKVEIKNQFRENLEPDRVAIAIKDVLTKAVQAPTGTGSRDNTYIGGIGGGFVGG